VAGVIRHLPEVQARSSEPDRMTRKSGADITFFAGLCFPLSALPCSKRQSLLIFLLIFLCWDSVMLFHIGMF